MTGPSFSRIVAELAADDPDARAIVCGAEVMTRAELDRRANRMARAYDRLGVQAGDFVTISLPNGFEWFVACLATWRLGAVPNPIAPTLPAAERNKIIGVAKPALVVGYEPADVDGWTAIPVGYRPDATLSDGALEERVSPIERALTSGGSTGLPKLICAQNPATLDATVPLSFFAAKRCTLIPGPLSHGIPYSSAWRSILSGAYAVVLPRFDASQCLELIERHRADKVSFVPSMMKRIWRLPEQERRSRDLSSLEFVLTSGAPCPSWLMQAWIDWLGPDVVHETFGSTERIGGTHISGREWLAHPGSVGRPVGGTRVRIVDPATGTDCPTGVMGEIYMMPPTGPQTTYRYIGADAQADADGWESVGDMGYLDAEGYLFLGDRRQDMIVCNGRNIYPAEIEAVLDSHPKVSSSAVIGLPDEDSGQAIHAIVEAHGVTESDLADHVAQSLVRYKVPRTIEFVDYPLRDVAGKVRRSALREQRTAKR